MAEALGRKIRIGVQSGCGHSWTGTRPPNVAAPVSGEPRVCGHPECYPAQFPVTYSEPVEVPLCPPMSASPACSVIVPPPGSAVSSMTASARSSHVTDA